MLDSLLQILTPIAIDEKYYSIVVALSSLSFVVSLVTLILKITNIFDADKVFDLLISVFVKNPAKRFSITVTVFILDSCVLVLDLCNKFFTIPADYYTLWIILMVIHVLLTGASAGAKFVIAAFWFGFSLPMLLKFKFLTAISAILFAVWMVFSTIVGVCDSILSYNDIYSIIKPL